ncbi:hypothetical protein C7T94_11270 [Pedobacter yulinensis]|uniref:Uncharacterized protein n=1 Tax=Pedobacter yulinensis TaxID=2126353 RepID=A0A2T3HL52_9SPHI|nr:hypothetical protein [Pedobacter yulinensis]PST83172.1 hypothetical protein C7T94_11270 [Pedobacter yulinensis]
MLDDALKAQIKDKLTGYLTKGVSTVLSGAGGTALKMILNLLAEGTVDPTAAMLEKIYDELNAIKDKIKNLPHATSVFVIYETAINDAQLYTETIGDLLDFNEEREALFGSYEAYLSSLGAEQWQTMAKFLTIEPKETYYSFINGILRAAYGINIANITQVKADAVIPFGDSSKSYARVVSETDLDSIPANFYEFVDTQISIRNAVFTATSGVILCAQLVLKTFQDVVDSRQGKGVLRADALALDSRLMDKIAATLNNPETKLNFMTTEQRPIPNILTKLLIPVLQAPQYLCGNAYTLFNAIISKQKVRLQNIARKKYLVLSGPEGFSLANRIAGTCDYWGTDFSDTAISWTVEFTDPRNSIVTITGPGIGYLYMFNPDPVVSNKIWVSPSKTNFGEVGARVKNSYYWQLQLVPAGSTKSGPGAFLFTLTNTKEDKALVNRIFLVGSDEAGSYKLDKYDGNHQWNLVPV